MKTEAIVNTVNDYPTVRTGCDYAVYQATGYDELLAYRKEHIGNVQENQIYDMIDWDIQLEEYGIPCIIV